MNNGESAWMYILGGALILLGLFAAAYGLFASGAAPYSDTLNIGLLNDKTNAVVIGGFLFSSGVVCVALESVARRLSRLRK